jgi:hypothetical protein
MAEILSIPELTDTIADCGIPNYSFLRCLNKEFHEMWNDMFRSGSEEIYLNEEERVEWYSKARILTMEDFIVRKSCSFVGLPKKTRYLKFSKGVVDFSKEDLKWFPNLQVVDFDDVQIDYGEFLFPEYRMVNYVRYIDPRQISTEITRLEKYEGIQSDLDKELCTKYAAHVIKRRISAKNLYIVNKRGRTHLKMIEIGDTFVGEHLYGLCKHLVMHTAFIHVDDIAHMLRDHKFESLKIVLTDIRNWFEAYREWKYNENTGGCTDEYPEPPSITDDEISAAKETFAKYGHSNVEIIDEESH